jgi:hypothetical protein
MRGSRRVEHAGDLVHEKPDRLRIAGCDDEQRACRRARLREQALTEIENG